MQPFYLEALNVEFERRKKVNEKYSLRAYARDLQFDPSTLLKILRQKRPLPLAAAERVSEQLNLSENSQRQFLQSVLHDRGIDWQEAGSPWEDSYKLDEEIHRKIISDWEYYAILNLFHLDEFYFSNEWMAKRLGLSVERTAEVVNHLILAGLIIFRNERWERTHANIKTSDHITSLALQEAHRQEAYLTVNAIQNIPPSERDIVSLMLPSCPSKLKEAKKQIRGFCRQMEALLEAGEHSEIYHLGIQYFPLTKRTSMEVK
ncbi:MAG: DUF4423 domain-containing protein [Bdellovibrionales bacterium]|nr:DUF4423 domain-containing protein [Bdellovibrionales bacterium]